MLLTVKSDKLTVSLDTSGAELQSVKTPDNTEYLWQAGKAWSRKSPVLFPFVCNFSSKEYKAGGITFKSPANHGFARDSEFEAYEKTDDTVCFKLSESEKTKQTYPYNFNLFVAYRVKGESIEVSYTVENTDDKDIYFYIGGHPGFNCPINGEGAFDDWYVEYEKNETIRQTTAGIDRIVLDNANRLNLSRELFDYDVILKDAPNSKAVTLKSDKSDRFVRLEYPDANCIAVWSPTANDEATFVCLEPWTSVPANYDDEFENIEEKPHAIKLSAGSSFTFKFNIVIG